ncbi:MAG: PAS domain-containing protein [Desulfobacterales bacterium]
MNVKDGDGKDILRSVFDSIPSLIFVVDDDVRIQEYNAAAAELLLLKRPAILKRRGGEVLNCLHAVDVQEGCGRGPMCKDCVIRNSVAEAFHGNRVVRRRKKLEILRDGNKIEIYALITASPFCYQKKPLVLLVIEDISEIAELQRLIPICSICKKVRDDKESWFRLEAYFKEHWDVDFSHGYCPECFKKEMNKAKKNLKTYQKISSGR